MGTALRVQEGQIPKQKVESAGKDTELADNEYPLQCLEFLYYIHWHIWHYLTVFDLGQFLFEPNTCEDIK